jgi:conjugative transfer signal peptidase TraF
MRKSYRAIAIVCFGLAPIAGLALLRSAFAAPVLVYNPSPSEPTGLYRLTSSVPGAGRLVAFRVPAPGRSYASQHIQYVARNSILKEIVAGSGSTVCERGDQVLIDGVVRGRVAQRDHNGVPLPHWAGCRQLRSGEYFALSNRIPNSFDSRYYGPVEASDILGVYAPVWTE